MSYALDILGNVKTLYEDVKIFPCGSIFVKNQTPQWYTTLRAALTDRIKRRDMRDGVASVNKADSVGKVQTVDVVETLLKCNTVDKITDAAIIATHWNSAGRPTEAALLELKNNSKWDPDLKKIFSNKQQQKNAMTTNNNFVNEYKSENMCVDQLFILHCYFLMGGGSTHLNSQNVSLESQFLFPKLYTAEQNSKGSLLYLFLLL